MPKDAKLTEAMLQELQDAISECIIYNRTVGLYRNLKESVFPERATPAGRASVKERLVEAMQPWLSRKSERIDAFSDFGYYTEKDRETPFFVDLCIPHGLGNWKDRASVFELQKGKITALVNADDHLTLIHRYGDGLTFEEQLEDIASIANEIGKKLPYAAAPDFGFLSAHPGHVGAGIFASIDVCLYGLFLTRGLEPTLRALERLGFVVEPVFSIKKFKSMDKGITPGHAFAFASEKDISSKAPFDEEEEVDLGAPGMRYRISLTHQFGDPKLLIRRMDTMGQELFTQESMARLRLINQEAPAFFDFVARSIAIGATAYELNAIEAIDLLSAFSFMVAMQYLHFKDTEKILTKCDRLFDEALYGKFWLNDKTPTVTLAKKFRSFFYPLIQHIFYPR